MPNGFPAGRNHGPPNLALSTAATVRIVRNPQCFGPYFGQSVLLSCSHAAVSYPQDRRITPSNGFQQIPGDTRDES